MKKKDLIIAPALLIASIIFWTCSREEIKKVKSSDALINFHASPDGDNSAQSDCNCGAQPPSCPDFVKCVSKLLGSSNSRTFVIHWLNCANADPEYELCNGKGVEGQQSSATLCYIQGSCAELCLTLKHLPSCLPCVPDPCNMQLIVSCSYGNPQFMNSDLNLVTHNRVTVSITGDPKITVSCGTEDSGLSTNCVGELR
jgi:hypothetical protein